MQTSVQQAWVTPGLVIYRNYNVYAAKGRKLRKLGSLSAPVTLSYTWARADFAGQLGEGERLIVKQED